MKKLLFILTIFSLLFLAGCGGNDNPNACKEDSDCSHLSCATCVGGTCRANTAINCCGNKQCEASENECSCAADCGKCESNVDYMTKECVSGECIATISSDNLVKESESFKIRISTSELSFEPSYNAPFLLGTSKINVRLKADKLEEKTDIEITRIKIYESKGRSSRELVSEKDINQVLYTINSEVNEDFILDLERNNTNSVNTIEASKLFIIEVIYNRKTTDSRGIVKETPSSFEKQLKPIEVIMPPTNDGCTSNAECNDANECTQDRCESISGYSYCTNTYITNKKCCGNKVCDAGEDKCSCAGDCGECNYDYGSYLQYTCSSNDKCLPVVKEETDKTKIFSSRSIPDFSFESKVSHKQPFNIKDNFAVEITLLDKQERVTVATIQSIQLIEGGDNLLGQLDLEETLMAVGESRTYKLNPSLLSMVDAETSFKPKIIINFKYTTKTGETEKVNLKKETLDLDEIYFVDLSS